MYENESWAKLSNEIENCKKCILYKTRNNVVIYSGKIGAPIMFIGEAPGKEEDLAGKPFVGRAGKTLNQKIDSLNIVGKYIIVNVLKCKPTNNVYKKEYEKACVPYLFKQIELSNPKLIITLGRNAWKLFSPMPLTQMVGKPITLDNVMFFPMFHPAAILHDPRKKDLWESSWKELKKYIENESMIK
ncbi:MAG: uracil-DNA glycosylase [Thermoplasmata archaeon]